MILNHFLFCKRAPICSCSFMNFEVGEVSKIEVGGRVVFSSVDPLIFAMVKLLDLSVPDIHLSPVKTPCV